MAAGGGRRPLGVWIAMTLLVAGLGIAGQVGRDRGPVDVASVAPPRDHGRAATVDPVAPAGTSPSSTTTTTVSPPTSVRATSSPTTTRTVHPDVVADGPRPDGLPFGDPDAEMPAEWADLCIPGTWVPEQRGCTWKPSHLVGLVTDGTGAPVPGICIGAMATTWSRSDGAGRWAADVTGFGAVQAEVWDCGSGSPFGIQRQRVPLTFEIGRTTEVAVVVAALGGVRGRVLDDAGRPVAGACVASGGRQDHPPVGPTGTDGRFELTGVRPGDHQLFLAPCPGSDALAGLQLDPPVVRTAPGTWGDADVVIAVGSGSPPPTG